MTPLMSGMEAEERVNTGGATHESFIVKIAVPLEGGA